MMRWSFRSHAASNFVMKQAKWQTALNMSGRAIRTEYNSFINTLAATGPIIPLLAPPSRAPGSPVGADPSEVLLGLPADSMSLRIAARYCSSGIDSDIGKACGQAKQ